MSDNVFVMLRDPNVWVCNCGCSTFELRSDGTAACAACDTVQDADGAGWSSWTAQSSKSEDEAFRDIQGNGSVDFARRRVAQMASDDTTTTLIVIRRDGSLSTWSEVETAEQMEWLRRKLDQAATLVASKIEAD